ncbi:MAG: amino acid adenylation domain-containing protein, partial [Saprospiraceae bacterium]
MNTNPLPDATGPTPVSDLKCYPLHLAQQEVYFDQSIHPERAYYNVGGYIVITGHLDKDCFTYCLKTLANYFDVLRLKFDLRGISPQCSFLGEFSSATITEIDFSQAKNPTQAAQNWMQNRFNHPYELAATQLYENIILKVGATEHWWFMRYHHLITDGFGFSIIMQHIAQQYSQLTTGKDPLQSIIYPSYEEVVQQSSEYLQTVAYQKDAAYWQAHFTEIPHPILSQPQQNETPSAEIGGMLSIVLTEKQRSSFEQLNEQLGTSLQQLSLAALTIYFGQTKAQTEMVFGVPIHKRSNRTLRKTAGMFTGVMPLKAKYSSTQTVEELIRAIKKQQRSDYRHQNYPISHLNRALKLFGQGRAQLFEIEVLYDYLNFELSFAGLTTKSNFIASEEKHSPLEIRWCDYGDTHPLELKISYQTAYFSPPEAALLAKRFLFILEQFSNNLTLAVANISLLPSAERKLLLHEFNPATTIYPQDKTFIDLFEAQAKLTPQNVALRSNLKTLSYQALEEKANQVARYLQKQGIQPQELIGLCLARTEEMLICLLAVQKLGAVYIPIDPSYPADRINFILADAKLKCFLIDEALSTTFRPQTKASFFGTTTIFAESQQESTAKLAVSIAVDELVYVIYTSGSTGKPKGVMVKHRGLVNFLIAMQQEICPVASKPKRFLALTTYSFDIAYLELYLPLLQGSEIILVDRDTATDGYALQKVLAKTPVDYIQATPSTWKLLLACNWKNKENATLLSGGEAISEKLKNTLTSLSTQPVWNLYGPTETTIWSTSKCLQAGERVTIGKPIANTQVYVLAPDDGASSNTNLTLAPIGSIGELVIGGDGLAAGYLHRPNLTAEKFIINPFGKTKNTRIYRTGDLVRWLANGELEYIGRVDDQVKIRGHRIELGEIESVLRKAKLVENAVVIAKNTETDQQALALYYLPLTTAKVVTAIELRNYLQSRLPSYMVPAYLTELTEFPLTSNGKIDKPALAKIETSLVRTQVYTAGRFPLEVQLVELWQHILELAKVGIHDNFFELGGHSLLASQLLVAIRETLQVELSFKNIFDYPTIAALAHFVRRQGASTTLPSLSIQERPDRIPLSFAQERLWFIDQLEGSTAYHMTFVQELSGDLDLEIFAASFQTIIERHVPLRTVCYEENGKVYQRLLVAKDWSLGEADHTKTNPEDLASIVPDELTKAFDLTKDFPLRVTLFQLAEHKYLCLLVIHHIAADGWSNTILLEELVALYQSKRKQKSLNLPKLSLQYLDYALWQRKYLTETFLSDKIQYWETQLSGLETLNLPTDYERPPIQSTVGKQYQLSLAPTLFVEVVALAKRENATKFMVLLAAFKILLHKYTGQEDICVGTPVANRNQANVSELIGLFVNSLALRSTIGASDNFLEILQLVKATTLAAYDHQEVPFEKIVNRVVTQRDRSRSPLFQVLFAYESGLDIEDLDLSSLLVNQKTHRESPIPVTYTLPLTKFDLSFTLKEEKEGEGIKLTIEYATALFAEATIARMAKHFEQILTAVFTQPQQKIASLNWLSRQELDQVLVSFNDTHRAIKPETVIDLFERQVALHPDRIAISFKETQLTYRAVAEQSNQLAQQLRALGAQPETLIGLCLDRSVEMIIAILAVLKSGAAYVPIAPDYPLRRIDYLLADTETAIVLTQTQHLSLFAKQKNLKLLDLLDNEATKIFPSTSLSDTPTEKSLAYVIYTSGSTGQAKGVAIEHFALYNEIKFFIEAFEVQSTDKHALLASYVFDASLEQIFVPLCGGATVVVMSKETLLDAEELAQAVNHQKVTHLHATPSLLETLTPRAYDALKRVCAGGEICSTALADAWSTYVDFYNEYGPTETTITSSYDHYQPEKHPQKNKLSIGKPIGNTQFYVLDEQQQLLPIGVTGELYIGGVGLARGYWNQPALTAEKFITSPFDATKKLYQTGDLACWLADGSVAFKGRKDKQIKLRGFRIELGEIEANLKMFPGVAQAVVLLAGTETQSKQLIAYVSQTSNTTLLRVDAILNYLKERLPAYLIPTRTIVVEMIPLTKSGKVDELALLQRAKLEQATETFTLPQTNLERSLASIWKEVLQRESIGIHQNFFELGGHSLLVMQIVAAARDLEELTIKIEDLFNYPTIHELANYVAQTIAAPRLPRISKLSTTTDLVLSFEQERLWFTDQLEGSTQYHLPFVQLFSSDLNRKYLAESFQEIV